MARRGRKRKLGNRVNGRLVQLSDAQRERDMKATALNQPHRKGDESQMRENAIGRMILRSWKEWYPSGCKDWSPEDFYTVAMMYEKAWADVRKVIGSGRPLANEVHASLGREPTDEEVWEWRDQKIRTWSAIAKAVGGEKSRTKDAMDKVVIDNPGIEWVAPFWIKHALKMALVNLAAHSLAGKRRAA